MSSTFKPFEVLKNFKTNKKKCLHKWIKENNKTKCSVCGATGFYDKEKNKVFMKKNSNNNNISIIDSELYALHFGDK